MNNRISLKFTILSISFLLMTRLTISPALAEIGKAFPDVSQESLMMMVVIPSLVGIIFGFVGSLLSNFMRAKTLIYIGLAGYLAGGLLPIFINDYMMILACRVLLGAGTGFFLPFCSGLISSFFEGNERNQMFGFQSASVGVGNVMTSILAGLLAAVFWKMTFLIYGFGFISMLLVILFLPEPEKETGEKCHLTTAMYFNPGILWVCFTLLLYAVLYFGFFGYIAFVVDQHQFGDVKASGLATMLMTFGSMLAGLCFGKLLKIFKGFSLTFSLVFNAAGFLILAQSSDIMQIFAGSFVLGLGFGFLMPYAVYLVNDYSDKAAYNYSNGLLMVAVNIGTALGPKILVTVGNIAHNPDGQFIFQYSGVCLTAAAGIALLSMVVRQCSNSR